MEQISTVGIEGKAAIAAVILQNGVETGWADITVCCTLTLSHRTHTPSLTPDDFS